MNKQYRKIPTLATLMMSISMLNPLEAKSNKKDEVAIKNIVESVGKLADLGSYETLEKLYADEIKVDYTSLAGGEAELKSPQALMTGWANLLPGFDITRHNISNIVVSFNGKTATATADVTADHYVADLFWQVKGDYVYELQKYDETWQITAHTLNLHKEQGTRDVFTIAAENAASNPNSYIKRQQTQQTVLDFLTALETKDMEKFASLLADDIVQDMPYSPAGHPKRVSGKSKVVELFSSWPEVSGQADFTSGLRFYPLSDPQMAFVEYKGTVEIITTQRTYKQVYGALFHVEDGQISLFREYFDPIAFKVAFGLTATAL